VADDFSSSYSQVWMRLYRLEISPDGKTYQTLYNNPSGASVNLPALSRTARFLGVTNMPAGSYTQARITLGDHLHMVMAGSGTSLDPPVVASGGSGANGQYAFVMNLPVSVSSGQKTNMVLDFNLQNFQMTGRGVQISVQSMAPSQFAQMQTQGDMVGTVTNLTPGNGFDLVIGGGTVGSILTTLLVHLSSSTAIFNKTTGAAATLANGQTVEVQGTLDPQTIIFTATTIVIQDNGGGSLLFVITQGTITSIDTNAKSFALAPTWAENFLPTQPNLTVQTDATTVFGGGLMGGSSFSDLHVGSVVIVAGPYDAPSNVLTARRVIPQ
jgi:hypothetical protein